MMNSENKNTFWQKFKQGFALEKEEWSNATKRNVKMGKIGSFFGKLFRALILIGLSFVILLPIFQKISYAFRSPFDVANPQVIWIPERLSTDVIVLAYHMLNYTTAVQNTILLSTIITFLQIIMAAVAGYAFARLKFKGSNVIFYIVLCTLVVPNESLELARTLFFTYNKFLGITLMKSALSMYIMTIFGMGLRSAIFIFLFRQTFRNIPIELEESAQVDGAGVIRTFWSIMLPNARGAIVTVGLFAFVWQWNDYYFANLFKYTDLLATNLGNSFDRIDVALSTGGKGLADALGINNDFKKNPLFLGLMVNTGALLLMLPLLIAYLFVQKLFVESIERTGITGM